MDMLPPLAEQTSHRSTAASLLRLASSRAGDGDKLKATAEDFEAQVLGTMFSDMVSQLSGDGPLGDEGIGADAFRGMLTDELGRSVARAGGIGIAPAIYGELLKLQMQNDQPDV